MGFACDKLATHDLSQARPFPLQSRPLLMSCSSILCRPVCVLIEKWDTQSCLRTSCSVWRSSAGKFESSEPSGEVGKIMLVLPANFYFMVCSGSEFLVELVACFAVVCIVGSPYCPHARFDVRFHCFSDTCVSFDFGKHVYIDLDFASILSYPAPSSSSPSTPLLPHVRTHPPSSAPRTYRSQPSKVTPPTHASRFFICRKLTSRQHV